MSNTIVLASNNTGKIQEFNEMLNELGLEIKPQGEFNVEEIEETGLTFIENAILKARNACAQTGLPAIADDSGIEVDFLDGAPGIYSARFSGKHGDFDAHNALILEKLDGVPVEKRTARFQCVLAYMRHENDPTPLVFQGTWEGSILTEIQGKHGFGYDPLFYVADRDCSAAMLTKEEKNSISHRSIALKQLLDAFRKLNIL